MCIFNRKINICGHSKTEYRPLKVEPKHQFQPKLFPAKTDVTTSEIVSPEKKQCLWDLCYLLHTWSEIKTCLNLIHSTVSRMTGRRYHYQYLKKILCHQTTLDRKWSRKLVWQAVPCCTWHQGDIAWPSTGCKQPLTLIRPGPSRLGDDVEVNICNCSAQQCKLAVSTTSSSLRTGVYGHTDHVYRVIHRHK